MEVTEAVTCSCKGTPNEMITLNVGGVLYSTTRATLSTYPASMLGAMFSGRHTVVSMRDPDGHIFIDCNGDMFKYILDFMRKGKLCLPDGFADLELLKAEADFFQIRDLITAVEKKIAERNPPKVDVDLSPCHLLEMVDVENINYEEYLRSDFGYGGSDSEVVLNYYPDLVHACFEGIPRGIILRGETKVLLSLEPTEGAKKDIKELLTLQNDDKLPIYSMVNLYRSSNLKDIVIKYLIENKWQLVSSSGVNEPEKQLSVNKYLWSMPKSECYICHKLNEDSPAQPM